MGRGAPLEIYVLLLDKWGRAETFSFIYFFSTDFSNQYVKVATLQLDILFISCSNLLAKVDC